MSAKARRYRAGYAFVLPWLLGLAFFIVYPFLAAIHFSFCEFPPLREPMLVGLANYGELLGDPVFHRSLGVTTIFAAVAIPLGVMLALTLALLLNARVRGQSVYRVVFYLPHLVPTVVVAILWLWIFNPQVGLLNMVGKILMGAADAWTGLFFELPKLGEAGGWSRPQALLLPLVPALGLLCWGPLVPRAIRRRQWLHRLIASVVAALAALVAFALIHVALYRLAPSDMEKLHSPGWLTDGDPLPLGVPFAPSWALWALIVMSMWGVGQMAVIYLAKLQDVPVELYEAADIDGASWWRKIWSVTIPMISPVILFNVVMAIIGSFQVFAQPYIMTGGGPEDKTRFVAMFVYDQAFQYHRIGYASAVAAVLFLLIVALTLLAFHISKKHVHYFAR